MTKPRAKEELTQAFERPLIFDYGQDAHPNWRQQWYRDEYLALRILAPQKIMIVNVS